MVWGVFVVALLVPVATAGAQEAYAVLHDFAGLQAPPAPRHLIHAADGNFYGVSSAPTYVAPTAITRLTPAGQISIVHALTAAEGTDITAFVAGSDGTFYGATSDGGTSGAGTIFQVTSAGTFTILHSFSGGLDGGAPQALVAASDGNFYGVTASGGEAKDTGGTFFRMTPGGAVSVLHSFTASDVYSPRTLMQASDGSFYGGALYQRFRITSSGALTVLTGSSISPSDYSPSTLIEGDDGNLYGTTGGTCSIARFCGPGLAFKMTPSAQVTVLHTFNSGEPPNGPLVKGGDGAFYGTTARNVFRMTADGTVTAVVAADDPEGNTSLVVSRSDGSLYGTFNAGMHSAALTRAASATLFHLASDNTVSRTPVVFADGTSDGALPSAALLEGADGNFYGTTPAGGTFGVGTVFRVTRGGALSVLHSFAGGDDGAAPYASLIQLRDGNFYGTTALGGGSANAGTVFRMSADGAVTIVHRFTGGAEGQNPLAPLIQATDGNLYGTSSTTIFRMAPGGSAVTIHALDPNVEGAQTDAGLVQGRDGSFYGVTTTGSIAPYGTIFRITAAGQVTVLYAFRLASDGGYPHAALVRGSDGNFYGTTSLAGTSYGGTIFRITPEGQFTLVRGLDTVTDGSGSQAPLLLAADGNFYGVTQHGGYPGTATKGTVFRVSPSGAFALVHTFDSTSGSGPVAALIQTKDGSLYGTAAGGGAANKGVVFRLIPPVAPPAMSIDRTSLVFAAVSTGRAFSSQTRGQIVRLQQGQGSAVQWTASSNQPWLTVTPASGSGSASITVAVNFDASLPASGSATGAITFSLTGASTTIAPLAVTLTLASSTAVSPPFGSFDTPAGDGAVLAGSVAVTGWALDNVGVRRVELWRDLVAGEATAPLASTPTDPRTGKVFIATATFVDGARPDVEALYPMMPFANLAGWGYLLLTWGLPNQGNGAYQLYAYAFDEEDNVATLGTKTIVVNNSAATKPFGSIDTPAIGGVASGPNFGWALTPKVNGAATCTIRPNGVQVSIDSGPLQPVVYGADVRSDIATAFAGFSNSGAAGGHYLFDWSTLSSGPHTIGWLVTDDCNRVDGVGSRFFTVANGTNAQTIDAPAARLALQDADAAITVSRGFGELPLVLHLDEGSRTVDVKEGERIEIRLPRGFDTAYQLVSDGRHRPLPIGSSWDAGSNTFAWQPAPGFLGQYRLVFTNGSARIRLRVVVVP